MNLPYVVPRLARHFLPEAVTRFLLLRSWIIKPGLETADPRAAVRRYEEILSVRGEALRGKQVFVFGYGGRFDLGVGLLDAGATFVILCDKFAPPDDAHNRGLLQRFGNYLHLAGGRPWPRANRMIVFQTDVAEVAASGQVGRADLVISNSVLEHVGDVEASIKSLAEMTRQDGLHVHFVDLRDHFFKYPFEMLTYSAETWTRWLDPTSHHNRLRLRDYRDIFAKFFDRVEIQVLARDTAGFNKVRHRIRAEFLTEDAEEDAATLIRILSWGPRR